MTRWWRRLVRVRFRRRDELRACSGCGHRWRVPRHLRRPRPPTRWGSGVRPGDRGIGGSELSTAHVQWTLDQAAARRRAHDDEMGRAAALAACSQCGSTAWTGVRSE